MRDSTRKFAILAIAAFALFAGRIVAWADDPALTKLLSGPPAHMGKELPKESYVSFEVRKLKRARVLWRNVDALKEKRVKVPSLDDAEALEKFDHEVLGHIGFAVFKEGMNEADFESETRELVADRYGGRGIGVNNGSGRAGSTGGVQIKGIGQTPLVGNTDGDSHSHGGMNFREGQADIVMGEMFNRELPYGANRVLFAIDTGLNLPGEGRRILIVREDPVRPAHYIQVYFGRGDSSWGDFDRLKAAGPMMINALPAVEGEGGRTIQQVFKARLEAYVDRTAEQYAAATAKRLFHGATSPSNYLVDGKFIDFSTSSALLGYGPVKTLEHVEAFGELTEVVKELVREMVLAANRYAKLTTKKKGKKGKQPPENVQLFVGDFESRFMKSYQTALDRQFLLLAGFPEEVVARLGDTGEGRNLAMKLQEVAFKRADWIKATPPSLKSGVPKVNTSKFEVAAVFTALAGTRVDASARAKLAEVLPDDRLRLTLSAAYDSFFERAVAKTPELSEREFAETMVTKAKERNRPLYEFFRDKVMGDANARMTSYLRYGNTKKFQASIDEAISSEGTRPPGFRLPESCELALMEFKAGWLKEWTARAQGWLESAQGWIKVITP